MGPHEADGPTSPFVPQLVAWVAFCQAGGRDPLAAVDDPAALEAFAQRVTPTKAIQRALSDLKRRSAGNHAAQQTPGETLLWPETSTQHLTGVLGWLHAEALSDPHTWWVARLRARRDRFVAVLVAPRAQGGCALSRAAVSGLTTTTLAEHLTWLAPFGKDLPAHECPACAVVDWLEVLATNNTWSHASVRALGQRCVPLPRDHSCSAPAATEFERVHSDWTDCLALVPAIDRWGWVETHDNLGPAALSALFAHLRAAPASYAGADMSHTPAQVSDRLVPVTVSPEREAEILSRADEINARIAAMLDHW